MDGLSIIKHFEGLKLEAYKCPGDVPTIGWGHTRGVRMGQKISVAQAEVFLDHDYQEAEDAVKELVTVPLTTNQLGALVSLVFNIGVGAFRGSTLRRKLNTGDYAGAADEFDRWVFASGKRLQGLVLRRKVEKTLFRDM